MQLLMVVFFEKGIGEGTLNTRVPEAHTDYVISVISEEFGVILILLILLIFLILMFKVLKKIPSEKNNINKLALIGSILLIIFQVLIHRCKYKVASHNRYDFTFFKLRWFINFKFLNSCWTNTKFY